MKLNHACQPFKEEFGSNSSYLIIIRRKSESDFWIDVKWCLLASLMLPLNLLLILLKLLLLLLLLFFLVMRTWKKFDLSSSSFLRNTFASLIGLNLRIWCFSKGWLFHKRAKNLQNNCWCFQLKIMLLPNNPRGFFELSNLSLTT